MRSTAVARFDDRRVLELRRRPPEILFPGARLSHEVKCLAVGHFVMSSPHSARRRRTVYGPKPWIWLRSAPSKVYSAARASKVGSLRPFACRRDGRGASGVGRVSFIVR